MCIRDRTCFVQLKSVLLIFSYVLDLLWNSPDLCFHFSSARWILHNWFLVSYTVSVTVSAVVVLFRFVMTSSLAPQIGDAAQLAECWTGTLLMQVRFPGAARDFSSRVNFQCRLSYGVCTTPCEIACINIWVHFKDFAVHGRVQWIMETLKHTACTTGWVHNSVAAGPPRGKQPEFPIREISLGQYRCKM